MSELCSKEIEQAVQRAASDGEILHVAMIAKRIAALCGESASTIAEELTRAGIRAGVTMQFGRPA